jgi:hypothetical protein
MSHPDPNNPIYNFKATRDAREGGAIMPWIGSEAIKSKINCSLPALQFRAGGLQACHS